MPGRNSWNAIPQSQRAALRAFVFERDGYRCMIRGPRCTGAAEELDHIRPRAAGGAITDPKNCRSSCRPCNRGRRPSPPVEIGSVGRPSQKW
jgi:5-methylcytosine-specific restriction endonuclease McrA